MKKVSFLISSVICFLAAYGQQTDSYIDQRDGKMYRTVKIGDQTWFAENLAYKADTGCWVYDNSADHLAIYGYLYNWECAMKVCPAGWHLPTDSSWTALIDYLGGGDTAGKKMRSTSGWKKQLNGTNSNGFSALPAGFRNEEGIFKSIGYNGWWWTATGGGVFYLNIIGNDNENAGKIEPDKQPAVKDPARFATSRGMNSNFYDMLRYYMRKSNAYSIRCLKD
jgi:uncharacterized protein (TIGR02145 family)